MLSCANSLWFAERIGSLDVTAPPPKVAQDGRRKSVFAEAYNPEDDEEDEKPVSIFYELFSS